MPTDYFANALTPGLAYFRCDRMRATLSTAACSGMWRKANNEGDDSHGTCQRCPLGAEHAGEQSASMSPLKDAMICARCHRTASRLISGMHCPSCYNRQREVMQGRNAKGTAPVKACGLAPRRLRYDASGDHRYLRLALSADMDELVVATLRDSRNRVRFGLGVAPQPAIRQMRIF